MNLGFRVWGLGSCALFRLFETKTNTFEFEAFKGLGSCLKDHGTS